jgi:hypothetical protein
MAVPPIHPPLVAVASQLPEIDPDENENGDPVTRCGRCRLNFVRHPSISPGDSPRWWLCPPCRSRLLGDESRTSSRWSS